MKKTMQVKGNRVAYLEQGSGEAVVLLHGFCGSSAYWQDVIPLLAETHRVIAPDLRGHGDSDAPQGTYSMEKIAEEIAGLLDNLGIGKAALFGHSLGGYVTLAFAERYAEKLSHFALVHSTALPDDEKGKQGREKSIETIEQDGLQSFIDGLVPKLFAPTHRDSMKGSVEQAKQIGYATSPQGAINTLRGMKERPDRTSILHETTLPVLLVAGKQDQVIPPEKTFIADGANITQALIEEAGHMSMYEAPE
ncbi:alpha/beta hydrolase, partial [Frankia sp. Cpl3]|nr:alpha/beta hydrolase [Frankia sp. Cpl3]